MKRLLLTAAVLGTALFTACEKDAQIAPAEKTLIKADKGILCRGCGDWDIIQPDASTETTTLRVTSTVDTTSTKPIRSRKNK
ncbi:MAG TPA: hypothetical protein VGE44_00660 [Daejeonella sp.]|jgi:hypothetical protein|uniref:hypothetical protein n=1 Tax=Daejeonella sp. TaxID=2805397 RepID=UPI002EDA0348